MTTPLIKALSELLTNNTNVIGIVQSVASGEVTVGTDSGTILAPTLGLLLSEGDEVTITNGFITGKIIARSLVPTYRV